MKKTLLIIISAIMLILMIVSIIIAITVTGNGFLDLSNIIRYFCIGFAIICGITSFFTFRLVMKSKK